jgi:D-arabinose 1-dehydrogenase-like Zn-dependent alcohol dehydrogenase
MMKKITASEARELMNPNERGEEVLIRLYPAIAEAARKKSNHVSVEIRVTKATLEWILAMLAQDGYMVRVGIPLNEAATHRLVIKW